MIDRIEAIHDEGLARRSTRRGTHRRSSRSCASGCLGRKAELPNLLRGVGELPPEQRGAGRQGAPTRSRKALEAS